LASAAPPQPISVSVAEAVTEELSRSVEVTGTLAAWEEATVSVEADGRLVQVTVDLGSRVKKGDVLAQIAPQEYSIRRAQSEADLIAAKADYARIETLVKKEIATRQQLDQAQRAVALAQAAQDMSGKKLGDTVVRAPIDGIVSRRLVNAGEYVRTGAPAFQVVRVSPLKFKADVPERYAPDVKVGDPVEVRGEALGPTVLTGEVVRIGPAIAAETRSFPIEARVDNPGEQFKPGLFGRVSIQTSTRVKEVTAPEAAMVLFAGNPRVFVADGQTARERTIEIDGKVRGRLIVRSGLQPGEKVIVTGVDRLTDGLPISIRAVASPSAGASNAPAGSAEPASSAGPSASNGSAPPAASVASKSPPRAVAPVASGGRALPADPPAAAQASATQGKASKGKP